MKLLVINPFATDMYDTAIETVCAKVKRPETELRIEHLKKALPFIRYRYFKSLIVPEIVEKCMHAEKDRFDGVFVSCCFEPGVVEARELVDIPVIGGAVPSVYIARQLGQRFGFITDTEQANTLTYEVFKQNMLNIECTSIRSIEMGVEQIGVKPKLIQEKVIDIARRQLAEGADTIIIGCTVVAAFFNYEDVPDDLKGIPIIDANVAALKTVEMLADLKHTINLTISRKTYEKVQSTEPEAFSTIRKAHGLYRDS